MSRLRFLHALFVAAGAGAVFLPGREAEPQGGPASVPTVMAGCHLCHAEYVKEWAASYHAKAWTDEVFQAEKGKLPKEQQGKCNACHIPNPTQVTGLGKMPTVRTKNQNEGVACVSCHQIPGAKPEDIGTIVGPFPAADMIKGHANKHDKTMATGVAICASCHGTDETHNQVESWKGSVYEEEGTSCQVCHMPEVRRGIHDKKGAPPREGRKHTWPGAHDPAFLKKAAKLAVEVADGKVKVTVTNDGAGHNLPGGGEREMVLLVAVTDAAGKEAASYRETFDLRKKNNRIKPKEARVLEFDAKAATGTVKARLIYKLLPDHDEATAVELASGEKKF
jgi:hypothetical protein